MSMDQIIFGVQDNLGRLICVVDDLQKIIMDLQAEVNKLKNRPAVSIEMPRLNNALNESKEN